MLTGAMLGLMDQLALDVITLTEEVGEAEFFSSRLTRTQTLKLLGSLVQTVDNLPQKVKTRLPGIDWPAWATLAQALSRPAQHPLQIWVAIKELTPVTAQQLKQYRKQLPQLFSVVP